MTPRKLRVTLEGLTQLPQVVDGCAMIVLVQLEPMGRSVSLAGGNQADVLDLAAGLLSTIRDQFGQATVDAVVRSATTTPFRFDSFL